MLKKAVCYSLLLGFLVIVHGQIPLDSVRGGLCAMVDQTTKQQIPISPSFTRVNVVVTEAVAQAVVNQTFVNPMSSRSEVAYLFPLPEQGAVHGMKYQRGDSLYVAEIMDREKAQRKFDSVRNAGGQGALLLQERPNMFVQRIASLGPGETAYVEIKLSLPLKYVDGGFELAFPTRIGPRFGVGPDGNPITGPGNPWNPPAMRSGPEFQFNVLIQSGVDLEGIASPTHGIEVGELDMMKKALIERQVMEEGVTGTFTFNRGVILKTEAAYPNRDFVLRMKRAKSEADFSLASWHNGGESGYFMLNLYPDTAQFAGKRSPLEVILLVDISGSQGGWPLAREKEIVNNILPRLTEGDHLGLMAFSDAVQYAFGSAAPVPVTPQNLATARSFVQGLSVQGGTQLLGAVKAALAAPVTGDKRRIFVFLTDGFITDESAILAAISGDPSHPTIFTFGAGNNLNRYFLEECAKVGNGFATPMVEGDAPAPLVEAAWSRIQAPQLENIKVDYGGLAVSEALLPVSDRLYRGLPYRILAKYARGGDFKVTLSASRQRQPVTWSKDIRLATAEATSWAVPKLWAREKIGRLMLGQGTTLANKAAIILVSVTHQVLSAYTAFLAISPVSVAGGNGGIATEVAKPQGKGPELALNLQQGMLVLDWNGSHPVVAVRIYDMHGKLLFIHRPGKSGSGSLRLIWDGRDAQGRLLARGKYLLSVETRAGVRSRPFLWGI